MSATPAPSSGGGGAGGAASPSGAIGERASGEGTASGMLGDADAGAERRPAIEAGQLTAGEWNDLEHWTFWRDLHQERECSQPSTTVCGEEGIGARMSRQWGYETNGRVAVRVVHAGDAVVDAEVELWAGRAQQSEPLWKARTDNRGHAELFTHAWREDALETSAGPYRVRVTAAGESVEVEDVELTGADAIEIELPVGHALSPSLDLMFVVDTTGSMGDELNYIQAELASVIGRVQEDIGTQLAVRLSVNFYRDHGDEYVVRPFPFSADIDQALEDLADQRADGGGDRPEAMEEALDDGVDAHAWSDAATARLLFLVLDAPPHVDEQRIAQLHASTLAAAAQGIRIVPLAASGIDKPTEFLLRNLAIITNGTYLFLTDDSGIGNAHLAPTIGAYDVELLDDLLVRVIREAL